MLVVGLGNPGSRYEANRHNVGFMVLDELVRVDKFPDFREKFSGLWTRGELFGRGLTLLKPLTYMNLSGDSVQPAAAFVKAAPESVIVVHDELDLPFGEVRVKLGGGHAGHNGVRSIMQRLGDPGFVRVRVGIGRPPAGFRGAVADYVLQDFSASEGAELSDVIARARGAIHAVVRDGVLTAMNRTNTKAPSAKAGRGA